MLDYLVVAHRLGVLDAIELSSAELAKRLRELRGNGPLDHDGPDYGGPAHSRIQPVPDTGNGGNRIVVRRDPPTITLDGIPLGVNAEQAVFVDVLSRNLGHWVDPHTFDQESLLQGERRDRLYRGLPKPIKKHIESKDGTGYWMILA